MKKHQYQTIIEKGPVIFTSICVFGSLIVALLLVIFKKFTGLGIFAICLFTLIFVLSIVTMLGLLLDYAYIEDDILIMRYIFKCGKIKISDIKEIKLNTSKNIYYVYDFRGSTVGTINSIAVGVNEMILYLDKLGVKIN